MTPTNICSFRLILRTRTMTPREVIETAQAEIKTRYSGRYAALVRKLGPGWYKMRLSRVLSNKNPAAADLFAVCCAAGVTLAPLLQQVAVA